jgi:hypothetical protein
MLAQTREATQAQAEAWHESGLVITTKLGGAGVPPPCCTLLLQLSCGGQHGRCCTLPAVPDGLQLRPACGHDDHAHRVKGLMAVQSMISLAVLVVVLSRVINILPS